MKQLYLKSLLIGILFLMGITANAYDCWVNGIYYNLDKSAKTASVTYQKYSNHTYSSNYKGSVTIPSSFTYSGTAYSVTTIGDYAFYKCSGLTSVTIPNSVTTIGDSAFEGCSGLTSVAIANSVTSIRGCAFQGCSGLISVTIPNSVTSIGYWAFYNCSGLTSIEIPNSVTSIGYFAFYNCSGLTSITIPNSVTSIGSSAFYKCNGLKKVISSDMTAWCKIAFENSSSNPLYNAHHLFSDENTEITELVIPNGVASIGDNAFYGCTGLTSVDIPSSVTSIGGNTFYGCTGLTSVDIPSSVTSIGDNAFYGCTGLTSVDIPSSVTSIGDNAFYVCTGLTKVSINSNSIVSSNRTSSNSLSTVFGNQVISYVIGNSVTSIGTEAFSGCTGLKTVTMPNSVTSIGDRAFSGCSGLTSVTIPNSVTSISDYAFSGCSGLTSVTIPNSVTSIGDYAFSGCSGLTSVTIPNSVITIWDYAFNGCSGLTSITIGNSVTSIGKAAFNGCNSLELVTINSNTILSIGYFSSSNLKNIFGDQVTKYVLGENVRHISSEAFEGCEKMTSIDISNSVTSIGYRAFRGCSGLTSITIPSSVTSIGNGAFEECTGLKTVTIPNSVTSIGNSTFLNCSSLTSIELPNSVTSIGNHAFYGCSYLTSVTMGNNVTIIEDYAFPYIVKILVNKGSKSLITLWKMSLTAYEIESGVVLQPSSISLVSSAQTSVTVTVADYCDGYTYTINDEIVNKGEEKTFGGMSHSLTLRVSLDDVSYSKDFSFKSKGLDLKINAGTTSSSINIVCSYTHGDAVVTTEEIYINGKKVSDGNSYYISGLDPNTTYTIMYSTNFESISEKVRTAPLILTTSQPKVISSGNVIVAAETNLDDEETNVGFEWRRTDWTSEFPSNSGTAYLYNGTMEGYIRNLNTEKLWKYRPYYTSNAGKTYYGQWVGIDPTNTSYFEPTVHTYANVSMNGNSAEVKGYVQRGTDNVVSKGFAYWEQSESVKSKETMEAVPSMISSLPSNAKTVEVSGSQQVMTAFISDLEYETTYCYVAFVRTSEGDTFYGEPREFTTDIDVTGIRDVDNDKTVTVKQRYDQNGMRLSSPRRGLNILLMSDGSTKKVWVK